LASLKRLFGTVQSILFHDHPILVVILINFQLNRSLNCWTLDSVEKSFIYSGITGKLTKFDHLFKCTVQTCDFFQEIWSTRAFHADDVIAWLLFLSKYFIVLLI